MNIDLKRINVGAVRRASHINKGHNSSSMFDDERFQHEGFGKVLGSNCIVNKNKSVVVDYEQGQNVQYEE
jgi:hypothetical protein